MLTPPNTEITVREVISRDPNNHLVEQSIEYRLPVATVMRRLRAVQSELEQQHAENARLRQENARSQQATRDAEIEAVNAPERKSREWHRFVRDKFNVLRDRVEGDGIDVPEPPTRDELLAFCDEAERDADVLAYGEDYVAARDDADGEVVSA